MGRLRPCRNQRPEVTRRRLGDTVDPDMGTRRVRRPIHAMRGQLGPAETDNVGAQSFRRRPQARIAGLVGQGRNGLEIVGDKTRLRKAGQNQPGQFIGAGAARKAHARRNRMAHSRPEAEAGFTSSVASSGLGPRLGSTVPD